MIGRKFRARLKVLSAEEGGRKTPFVVGYRPQFHAHGASYCTDFLIENIEGRDAVPPGANCIVQAHLIAPDEVGVPVQAGTEFELHEGNTVIARGAIEGSI